MAIKTKGDIYKYSIELKILLTDASKKLETLSYSDERVQFMYVDYDYIKYNMPMIFLTLSLDKKVIDKMIACAKDSLINLTVYKFVDKGTSTKIGVTKSIYFQEQFEYFMAKDYNTNNDMDYVHTTSDSDDILQNITIGLLKKDHVNMNKKHFSGVIKGATLSSAIFYCCNGLPLLMEPITHEKTIKQLIIPPIVSVSKAIRYLNENFQAFYDTPYIFFMDFQTTYLKSCNGKPLARKGDQINSIVINIRKITDQGSYIQGIFTDTKNKIYELDVGQNDAIAVENNANQATTTRIIGVGNTGMVGQADLKNNKASYTQDKNSVIRLNNSNADLLKVMKYQMEMENVTLEISKNDIDGSIFSINNEYSVKASDTMPGRDGKYLLVHKKEVYVRDNDHMVLNCLLTFKKVPA